VVPVLALTRGGGKVWKLSLIHASPVNEESPGAVNTEAQTQNATCMEVTSVNSTQSTPAAPALVTPTRGPWTVNGEGGIVARIHYFGEAAIYVTAPTTSAFDGHAAERATADAHLIAAAPDLRDALIGLLRCVASGDVAHGSSASSQELSIACAKANIALDVAKGGR